MPVRQYTSPSGRVGRQINVSCMHKGRQKRASAVYYDISLGEARIIEAKMHADLTREVRGGSPAGGVKFHDLVDEYLKASKQSKRSYLNDIYRAETLKEFFGNVAMEQITVNWIIDFREHRLRDRRPATVNNEVSLLSAMFQHARRSGYVDRNPCHGLKRLEVDNLSDRVLDDMEIEKICDGMPFEFVGAVLVARFTGLRRSAVLELSTRQIVDGVIYPKGSQRGSKRVGRVPLRDGLGQVIKALKKRNGSVLFTIGWRMLRRYVEATREIEDVGYWKFHDLRRTFASEAAQYVGYAQLRIFMGHGKDNAFSPSITERYIAMSDDDLRRSMALLPPISEQIASILQKAKG